MTHANEPLQVKHCNTPVVHPPHKWSDHRDSDIVLPVDYECEGQKLEPKTTGEVQQYRSWDTVQSDLAKLGGANVNAGGIEAMTHMPEAQYFLRLTSLTGAIIQRQTDTGEIRARRSVNELLLSVTLRPGWSAGTQALIDRETEKARYREEEAAAKAKAVERDRPEREYIEAKRIYLDPEDEWGGTDLAYILFTLIPDLEQQLINAARHYGATNHNKLGIKAQYVDLHRKMGPLRSALWEDQILTRESPSQILMDLAGHAFLTRAMLDRGTGDGSYDDL